MPLIAVRGLFDDSIADLRQAPFGLSPDQGYASSPHRAA